MRPVTDAQGDEPHSDFATPAEIAPQIRDVTTLVQGLAERRTIKTFETPDRPQTITLMGGRGQGKSTALVYATAALRDAGHLVLPVIDPEQFAPGDTLIGWSLAYLQQTLSEEVLTAETAAGLTVRRAIEDLSHIQALTTSEYALGLAQRGVTPEEFARDAAVVPARGSRFTSDWIQLTNDIASAGGHPSGMIVVPIDDADLYPSVLPSLLADCQALGRSPRVVSIMAIDEATLAQALTVNSLSENAAAIDIGIRRGLLSPDDINDLTRRRIVKHFPRSLRVRLEPVSPEGRLAFHPIGIDQTVEDLLRSFKTKRNHLEDLSGLFVIRDEDGTPLGPNDYASCLSDNRRDLRQLHEVLSRIDPQAEGAPAKAFAAIIEHGIESALPGAPIQVRRALSLGNEDEAINGVRTISFQLDGIDAGRMVGFGNTVFRVESQEQSPFLATTDLSVRDMGEQYMELHLAGSPSGRKDPDDDEAFDESADAPGTVRLSQALTHLILLAWEGRQFEESKQNLLRLRDLRGRVVTPGLLNWRDQIRPSRDTGMSWRYWQVPDWECFSDYFVFVKGWNRIRSLFVPDLQSAAAVNLIEFLLLCHIELVLTVHERHAVSKRISQATTADVVRLLAEEAWPEYRDAFMDELDQRLRDAHGRLGTVETESQRDSDFRNWLAFALPFMAVRAATTPKISDWIMDLHQDLSFGPSLYRVAGLSLAEEVNRHLIEERADAEIDILQKLAPERAKVLRDLRTALGQQQEGERAAALRDLTDRGVREDLLERLRSSGATSDVLAGLALMAFTPQSLVRIAQLFPSTDAVSPDTVQDLGPL
jgi:hypothetical protein